MVVNNARIAIYGQISDSFGLLAEKCKDNGVKLDQMRRRLVTELMALLGLLKVLARWQFAEITLSWRR